MTKARFISAVIIVFALCSFTAAQAAPSPQAGEPANEAKNTDAATSAPLFPESLEQPAEGPSGFGLAVRTLGALSLVLGLLIAGSWAVKRFGGGRLQALGGKEATLSVLTSVSIGEKRSLTVVRFRDRILLLGATPQAINLLAEDSEEPSEPAPPAPRSVAEVLRKTEDAIFEDELAIAKSNSEFSNYTV